MLWFTMFLRPYMYLYIYIYKSYIVVNRYVNRIRFHHCHDWELPEQNGRFSSKPCWLPDGKDCFLFFKSCFDLCTCGGQWETCQSLSLVRLLFAFCEVWNQGLKDVTTKKTYVRKWVGFFTSGSENRPLMGPNVPGAASVVEQRPKLALWKHGDVYKTWRFETIKDMTEKTCSVRINENGSDSESSQKYLLQQTQCWLVVWNMFYFQSYIGNNHPNWLSYFSEGLVYHQPEWFSGKSDQPVLDSPRSWSNSCARSLRNVGKCLSACVCAHVLWCFVFFPSKYWWSYDGYITKEPAWWMWKRIAPRKDWDVDLTRSKWEKIWVFG